MEKSYAILMDRSPIYDGIYLYRPQYIVSGYPTTIELAEDMVQNVFVDDMSNQFCYSDDPTTLCDDDSLSVMYPITESELKKIYPEMSLEDAKASYLDDSFNGVYIGVCELDDEMLNENINILKLQFEQIDEALEQLNYANVDEEDYSDKILIGLDKLKELIAIKDLEKLKSELNLILSSYEEINNMFETEFTMNSNDRNYYVTLFAAVKDHMMSINNLEEMYDSIEKIQNIYLELSVKLDERKANGENVYEAQNLIYDLSECYDKLLELDDINDIKEGVSKIFGKEEARINQIVEKFEIVTETIEESKETEVEEKRLDVREMKKFFDRKIIGQDEAKKDVISALFMNEISTDSRDRNNVLLVGPTGSGKTLIAEATSEFMDKPIEIIDTTQLTMPGYVGSNIEDFLERLLAKTKGNLEQAENGVVVFDEIDKKGSESNDDVSGKGVLNTLLPFIQGTTYDVKYNGRTMHFNTSNLTIFATGAFTDVATKSGSKLYGSGTIGFGSNSKKEDKQDIEYKKLEIEDFVKYGNMPIELIGRFTTITQLTGHTKESLRKILTDSDISALVAEREKLQKININLGWTDGYIDAVADKALELKTGARSLKATVEKSVKEARWEVINNLDIYSGILLNENTVNDNLDCLLVDKDGNMIKLKDIVESKDKTSVLVLKK